jgi:arsenate reductase
MNKKVLILCTGNSCRSIISEAIINRYLDGIKAYSSGVKPSGMVNPNAKRVLEENGIWRDEYHSKEIEEIKDIDFDLVVTVCDHAKESCPVFLKQIPTIHVGFEDPDGKEYEAFKKCYKDIKEILLPKVREKLGVKMNKNVSKTDNGVKISFTGAVQKQK